MTLPVKPDYQSYLSSEAKGRLRSQLRALIPYTEIPGMISFGGGLPHPSTWPIDGLTLSVPFAKTSVFVPGFECRDPSSLLPLAPYPPLGDQSLIAGPLAPDLTRELNYSTNFGIPHFVSWITEHVKRIHNPPYPEEDWRVLCTAGNTDGSDGVIRTLINRGESLLLEEFAFPGTLTHYQSMGARCVGVPMDGDGIVPHDLEEILAEWDEQERGSGRPKAILLVPTCSNPTGITYPRARKEEIYAVCRKWNVLIIEDDPYCYLQMRPKGVDSPLVPSFLSLDVDGRVIRLDSFSKFIAPGARCGWISGPKDIVIAIMRKGESSASGPSGLSVASISAVIQAWGGHEGLEQRYLPYISDVYAQRSAHMVSMIRKHVTSKAVECPDGSGGMFLWVRLCVERHPLIGTLSPEEISYRVFTTLVKEKVLVVESAFFKTPGGPVWSKEEQALKMFLRLSFSYPNFEDIEEGVKRMARGLAKEWDVRVQL